MDFRSAFFLFEDIMRSGVRGRKRVPGTRYFQCPVVATTSKFS